MKIEIKNFKEVLEVESDLTVVEKIDYIDKAKTCSLVTVGTNERKELIIKFEWKEESEIDESDFLFVNETNILFFRTFYQWGAIDVVTKVLKRHEGSFTGPFIYKENNYVLILDDLSAESTKLNGDRIDRVPIDPPTDSKEFEDRIEYDSPVFGKQVLKTK